MSNIAIIDYGMGNLYSVTKAIEYVAEPKDYIIVTSDADKIASSDKVIFPGQGAAKDCMSALQQCDLQSAIIDAASQKPFLGICMGMQVLMQMSEENDGIDCLGLYSGSVKYFGNHLTIGSGEDSYKVPHMGWNCIEQQQSHPLWKNISESSYFYFVHSYFVATENERLIAGTTNYGPTFTSVIAQDNVFAMQCHPEKSAQAGLQLLKNFIHWDGNNTVN
ncbi:MAG: imidazole glycerol phosphate synthase subunit HisH [Gammaproteobacteria bacterium]|nr:MAG: imidazole glycerol phosphate synthase subunit HisH [Gammaproteobacteria bacterium]